MDGVRFIRKDGKIIPIRDSNDVSEHTYHDYRHQQRSTASKTMVAGAGVAAIAGFARAGAHMSAKKELRAAKEIHAQASKLKRAASREKYASKAAGHLMAASRHMGSGRRYGRAGVVFGSALIANGVNRVMPETAEHPVGKFAISVGSGVASAYAINKAYDYGLGSKAARSVGKAAGKSMTKVYAIHRALQLLQRKVIG